MMRVFVRPVRSVRADPGQPLKLGDVAQLATQPPDAAPGLARLPVGRAPEAGHFGVLRVTDLVGQIVAHEPEADIRLVGGDDVVIESHRPKGPWQGILGAAAGVLLAIGAATAILNFHADVNMPAAHREVYRLLTGRRSERPVLLEVPYAIGVGAGILLFFRRPGRRGPFPGEPSPLQIELSDYEHRLYEYWRRHGPEDEGPPG